MKLKDIAREPWFPPVAIGAGLLLGWGAYRYFSAQGRPADPGLNLPPGTGGNDTGGQWLDGKVQGVPPDSTLKSPEKLAAALGVIEEYYGQPIAKNVEKIYRLETAHFTSGQYLRTGSPGMLAFSEAYPYGWTSLQGLWDSNPPGKPIGIARYQQGTKTYNYLAFPNLSGMIALAEIMKKRGNNPGAWYSHDPSAQAAYNLKIAAIPATLI